MFRSRRAVVRQSDAEALSAARREWASPGGREAMMKRAIALALAPRSAVEIRSDNLRGRNRLVSIAQMLGPYRADVRQFLATHPEGEFLLKQFPQP